MAEQLEPKDILAVVKKNRHAYSIASEPFSADHREFVVYNISLKKDYTEEFQYLNCRRGLAYIEEIIEFNNENLSIARKGLRKFKDLLPEYVDIKESHLNHSKYHLNEKERMLDRLMRSKCSFFRIYNTDKLNGENAQISYVYGGFWIFGSKNKTLLFQGEPPANFKNQHEHKLTLLIACEWFKLLSTLPVELVQSLKQQLENKTLVGEYCNSENLQHLVDYGKEPKIFFYALVEKQNKIDDCLPTSQTMLFCKKYSLPCATYDFVEAPSVQGTIVELQKLVKKINQQTMKEKGEGSVIYVSGVEKETQENLLVCKIKTIEYRIFRKLREKLKVYLQKFTKGHTKLHKQFVEEITEISREFQIERPLEYYAQLALKAFQFCEDQNKPLSRLLSNKFITFLSIIQRNDISKPQFLAMVKTGEFEMEPQPTENQEEAQEDNPKVELKPEQKLGQEVKKRILVCVPMTLPSTGKSTIFSLMRKLGAGDFAFEVVSSDSAREQVMQQKMKRNKNMSKQAAYQKSRKEGNDVYYQNMGSAFEALSKCKQPNGVLFLDKNHPDNALAETIKQIKARSSKYSNIIVKIVALTPEGEPKIAENGKYKYPFTLSYALTCLKRVSMREAHQTLEGSIEHRFEIVIGFANLFRNMAWNAYTLSKHFQTKLQIRFHQQQEIAPELQELFLRVMLSGKPGKFQIDHPELGRLVEAIKEWPIQEIQLQKSAQEALRVIEYTFEHFQNLRFKYE